jgi:ABC-2 type transport system ATP-binding protein
MTAARLAARNVAWSAADRFVLLDVEVGLMAGELALLVGSNGAGKTTLLELLAGHRQPLRGTVTLDGVALPDCDPAHVARRIAVLGHQPGLYLDLSAHENVALLVSVLGIPIDAATVTAALVDSGIAARDQHRPVRGFSRGMLQRTALARVRLCRADVWLLDEPTTGLDSAGIATLRSVLAEARQQGVALCVATHDPQIADLADRRLQVAHGQVQEVAS